MTPSYEYRGKYNHRELGKQLLRFDGMEYGSITPMDIDCTIDWKDRAVVLIEIKRKGVILLRGERLTLERYVRDFQKAGKRAIAIVAEHKIFDPSKDVLMADCLVRELYYSEELVWRQPKKLMTVKELVDGFLRM